MIRKNYLNQPAPETESLVLRNPQTVDASAGQAGAILRHLNNQASFFLKGFFFFSFLAMYMYIREANVL